MKKLKKYLPIIFLLLFVAALLGIAIGVSRKGSVAPTAPGRSSASVCLLSFVIQPVSCNSTCTTDSNCNSGMKCVVPSSSSATSSASTTGFCRNPSCTDSTTCLCPTPTPSPTPAYVCGSSCTSDAQCQFATNQMNFVCDTTSKTCRLNSNLTSNTCTPAPITCATGAFNDSFSGISLDYRYSSAGVGSGTIANNQLNVSIPAKMATVGQNTVDYRYAIEVGKPYTGDFDTTLTDVSLNSPNDNQGLVRIAAQNSARSIDIDLDVVHTTSGNVQFVASDTNQTTQKSAIMAFAAPVKLKLSRVGTTFSLYYSVNSSTFTKLTDYTVAADAFFVRAVTRGDGSNTTTDIANVTAAYSNFNLMCPVAPTPTPTPTPAPGCNSVCATNSDCPSNMTCNLTTGTSSGYCRNPNALDSTTCTVPVTGGFYIRKFFDHNGNGIQDTNDEGLDWKFQFDENGDNNWRDYQTFANKSGEGGVVTLPVDTQVRIKEIAVSGWTATNPTNPTITIRSGENQLMVFGNWKGASPTPTQNPTPTPTAALGCNSACITNSDCPSSMNCNAGACRNPSCTDSTNCTCAVPVAVAPTPTPTVLLKTGAIDDTLKLVAAGVGAVVLGMIGLLAL